MTTNEPSGSTIPPVPPPTTPPRRLLRRSTSDRIAAGVSGGLGDFFGLDPVLFRVLFAVSAFFGGAGVLAYAIAWAAIPSEDADHAPIDSWISQLRARRVLSWLIAIAAGLALWGVAFSWWAPRPFFPVICATIVVILLLSRSDHRRGHPKAAAAPVTGATDSAIPTDAVLATAEFDAAATQIPATDVAESATTAMPTIEKPPSAWKVRRQRTALIRAITLSVLIATVTILGIVDAVAGIRIPVYFWVAGGILLSALLIGAALRRTPWSLAALLAICMLGLFTFGGSHASFHDGVGQKIWVPTSQADLDSSARLAMGQAVLDLRHLDLTGDAHVTVIVGAGQVRVLLPEAMKATVHADVHMGHVSVDGEDAFDNYGWGPVHRSFGVDQIVPPPATASGFAVNVDVELAAGHISVERS